MRQNNILVVGAGPTGLTAAIELARSGHNVSIIDKHATSNPHSCAVGINARSLELLEAGGITERLLAQGRRIQRLNVHLRHKIALVMDFSRLSHRFNFLLALPQNETEDILREALSDLRVQVQYDTQCMGCDQEAASVRVWIKGQENHTAYDYLFAADGAHSTLRETLAIPFAGKVYPDHWQLQDVVLDWPFGNGEAHLFVHNEGRLLFAIPLPGERTRLIATNMDCEALLPPGSRIVHQHWASDFRVQCRQVATYHVGRVFLGGDAAHVHSPAGGRGMNLGIEDAMIFAKLLAAGQLEEYAQQRHRVGARVLMETDRLFRLFRLSQPLLQCLRNMCIFPLMNTGFVQKKILPFMAGLK